MPDHDAPADDQVAGQPSSREITVPATTASRHAAIRRASSGLTRPATSPGSTNSYPASSPSGSVIAVTSPGARTPPSYTTISPSGRSGREGTQSTTSTP